MPLRLRQRPLAIEFSKPSNLTDVSPNRKRFNLRNRAKKFKIHRIMVPKLRGIRQWGAVRFLFQLDLELRHVGHEYPPSGMTGIRLSLDRRQIKPPANHRVTRNVSLSDCKTLPSILA